VIVVFVAFMMLVHVLLLFISLVPSVLLRITVVLYVISALLFLGCYVDVAVVYIAIGVVDVVAIVDDDGVAGVACVYIRVVVRCCCYCLLVWRGVLMLPLRFTVSCCY